MDWWEDEFCERLAAGSRFIVRYDHRDTGESVSYEPGAPTYTGRDLVDDVLALLDALELSRVHVVGMSMGGAIAQLVAIERPERVASLTLISTAPSAPGPDDPDLPTMSDESGARFAAIREPTWSDTASVVEYLTELACASAARSRPFDEAAFRELARRVVERTTNVESSMKNHEAGEGLPRWRDRLRAMRIPTLVVHGTEDPVVPHGNGVALSAEIPGARLLTLEKTGHELPRATWDALVPAILEHTSPGATTAEVNRPAAR